MSDKSAIEWTDATWNPVTGCSRVSAGCAHCYAETFAERWRGIKDHPFEQGFDLKLWPKRLSIPHRWKAPRRVFVNSMSDLFHEDVPFEFISRVFGVMALEERHTFQVLTKRPKRMLEFMAWAEAKWPDLEPQHKEIPEPDCNIVFTELSEEDAGFDFFNASPDGAPSWPPRNVWLGVSVEDQGAADVRIPLLLRTPAAVRFLSCEPLLGSITFRPTARGLEDMVRMTEDGTAFQPFLLKGIDWVIVGGESGPGARPMDHAWVHYIKNQCEEMGTAFFMKQLGGVRDKRGGVDDIPAGLFLRQFPEVVRG